VSAFRLYFISPVNGRFERVHEFEAATDDEALGVVASVGGSQVMELWSGARHVKTFEESAAADTLRSAH
jgi:hypothetical protein